MLSSWRDGARLGQRVPPPAPALLARPVEVSRLRRRVAAFRYERTEPDGDGRRARHRRDPRRPGAGRVPRGRATSARALPRACRSTSARGVIPNDEGRVLDADGKPRARHLRDRLDQARPGRPDRPHQGRRHGDHRAPGRRPRSAAEPRRPGTGGDPRRCSRAAASQYTDLDGWHALDAHERALGAATTSHRASASRSCRATSRSRSRAPGASIAS